MKKNRSNYILIVIFLLGLGILLYPTISDYVNSKHQSRVITKYEETIKNLEQEDYDEIWLPAEAYNRDLMKKADRFMLTEEEMKEYFSLLDPAQSGIMGSISIPRIHVELPIYHDVSESVLQIAVGHIPGSSLPTGGSGTHTVLSGHRGLPSSKLFTDLDQIQVGDQFYLINMDRVLAYEVDQIKIVLPYEMQDLLIDPEQDYCTLTTCTPYGINTHRLLVRGHRVDYEEEKLVIAPADAVQIDAMLVAPVVAAPMLLMLLILVMTGGRKKRNHSKAKGGTHQ